MHVIKLGIAYLLVAVYCAVRTQRHAGAASQLDVNALLIV